MDIQLCHIGELTHPVIDFMPKPGHTKSLTYDTQGEIFLDYFSGHTESTTLVCFSKKGTENSSANSGQAQRS